MHSSQLQCPAVVWDDRPGVEIHISPRYYRYSGCACPEGMTPTYTYDEQGAIDVMDCQVSAKQHLDHLCDVMLAYVPMFLLWQLTVGS